MRYRIRVDEETLELDVEPRSEGGYSVRGPDGRECVVDSLGGDPAMLSLLAEGQVLTVLPSEGEVRLHGERYPVRAESWQERGAARPSMNPGALARSISASMPGRIVRVLCEAGAQVGANAPLIVIEAMKMQNELCAKNDATVRVVHVSVGQTVERGAILIEFE